MPERQRRLRAAATALLIAATGLAAGTPTQAQTGADLYEACLQAGASEALCRGLHQTLRIPGGLCRDATGNLEECELIDGITVSEALVAAHESSWLGRALAMQVDLDEGVALRQGMWVHTHNSYNADAYPPTLFGLDRNHVYSIRDQLRMGTRALELDLHWAHSTSGDPANDFKAVVVCHGQAVDVGVDVVHFGCGVNDPLLPPVLAEIRQWMDENPDEFLMIYLENALDDDPVAHDQAAAALEAAFGDILYRPGSGCSELPIDMSRRDLASGGARVILTGNCGPGAWGDLVFERGPRWRESGLGYGSDFPAYPCAERRAEQDYDNSWIRHWGDETGLSAGAQAGGDLTEQDARNMTLCAVNMIGFDNLVPFDGRLEQLVWSWATNEPATDAAGQCAWQGDDARFRAEDCASETERTFACFGEAGWATTSRSGVWTEGDAACDAEGLGVFAVPWNGFENQLLHESKPDGTSEVWLNYGVLAGIWTPDVSAQAAFAEALSEQPQVLARESSPETNGPDIPSTRKVPLPATR